MELPISASDPVVSVAHLDCIAKVVYSAQKLLDIIFSLHFREDGPSLISYLPIVFIARALYAWVTLVRVAAIGSSVYDEPAVRVSEYLEKLMQVLDESAEIAHYHTAMSTAPSPQTNTDIEFSWVLRVLRRGFKHKRGVPPIPRPEDFTVTGYQSIRVLRPGPSDIPSTGGVPTILRPLEPEFPTEMDFPPQQSATSGTPGDLSMGDDFDWDAAIQNVGNFINSFGGFTGSFIEEQQFG